MALKQVILVRQDLQLPKGKLAVQVAHASTELVLTGDRKKLMQWKSQGMKKVVLKVKDEAELMRFKQAADTMGLNSCVIRDAGLTTVKPNTVTCIGIGPDEETAIDRLTGMLGMV